MFSYVMPGPTAIAAAGMSALGQALECSEEEDARRSSKWREDLTQRLEADLTNLDSLVHGFAPTQPDRGSAKPASGFAEIFRWLALGVTAWRRRPS